MTWTQVYTPVAGSVGLSALAAALPVAVLLGLLAFGHARAHWAVTFRQACMTPAGRPC